MTIEKLKEKEPLFSDWYIESKVAEGRSSKVFKAYRQEEGSTRYMCVKTVRFPHSNNEIIKAIDSGKYRNVDEYLEVLQNGVCHNMDKMLELKDNGNIVSVENYEIVKESSCFYVVMLMELLTPLSDYLKADRIKPKEVIKIGWDLCNALEGFRHEGIVHSNIKPDNIYVDSSGNYKLGDFGISNIGQENREPSGYSAPELFSGNGVSESSDVYSLGVVLYKLLNNNRGPFLPDFPAPISLSDREQANVRRLRGDMFPSPSNADYNLSKIIFKATAFRPEERYESPFLMRKDFETYLQELAKKAAAIQAAKTAKTHHVSPQAPAKPRYSNSNSVTNEDKEDFAEAFTDDESDDEVKTDKKWLYIVMALVIVLALVVAVVAKSVADRNKTPTTEEVTTSATTQESTTQETTTEEATTEETTTEETTTEETTTEETTTEETTTEETTAEETTTEETTTEETTEEETTEEPTTEQMKEPILVGTDKTAGTKDDEGREYINIENYSITENFEDVDDKTISVQISDDLGNAPQLSGDIYIYMMAGEVNIQTAMPGVSLVENDDGTYLCNFTVYDEEFFYDPAEYQYYLCFEEGAIVSDASVVLPVQIKL